MDSEVPITDLSKEHHEKEKLGSGPYAAVESVLCSESLGIVICFEWFMRIERVFPKNLGAVCQRDEGLTRSPQPKRPEYAPDSLRVSRHLLRKSSTDEIARFSVLIRRTTL